MVLLIFLVVDTAALQMGDLFPVVVDPVFGDHGTIGDDHPIHGLRLAIPGHRHPSHAHRMDSLCIGGAGIDRGEAGRLFHLDDQGVAFSIRRLTDDDIEVGCIKVSRFTGTGPNDPDFGIQGSLDALAFLCRLVRIMVPQEGDGILPDLLFHIPQLAFCSRPAGTVAHIEGIPAGIAETGDIVPGLGVFFVFFRDYILQFRRLPSNGQGRSADTTGGRSLSPELYIAAAIDGIVNPVQGDGLAVTFTAAHGHLFVERYIVGMVEAVLIELMCQDQIPVRLSVIDRQGSRFTGLGFHFLQLAHRSRIAGIRAVGHILNPLVPGRNALVRGEFGFIVLAGSRAQIQARLVQVGGFCRRVPHVDVRQAVEALGELHVQGTLGGIPHHTDVVFRQGIHIRLATGNGQGLVQLLLHHVLFRRIGAGSHIVVPGEPQPVFQDGNFMGIAHIAVVVSQAGGGGVGAGQRRGTHGGRDVGLGLIYALQAQHAVGTGGAVLQVDRFRGQGCHTAVFLTNVQSIQLQLPIQVHIQGPVISYAGSDVAGGIRIGAAENLQGISQVLRNGSGITGKAQAFHVVVRTDDGLDLAIVHCIRIRRAGRHVGNLIIAIVQAAAGQAHRRFPLGLGLQCQLQIFGIDHRRIPVVIGKGGAGQARQVLGQTDFHLPVLGRTVFVQDLGLRHHTDVVLRQIRIGRL